MKDKPKVRTRNVNAKLTAFDLGYKPSYQQKVISVTARNVNFSDWPDEARINIIGQNGNTGEHYENLSDAKALLAVS